MRLPLARNSESSRDLRPRPPAANKSAGRLQTQNFHVGKSQDGRERSGARGGSRPGNAWRPALEGRLGSLRRAHEGPLAKASRPSTTTASSPGSLWAPRTPPAARAPRPEGSSPLPLRPWLLRVAGDGTVARVWGKMGKHFPDLLHARNSCSGAVCGGRGSLLLQGKGGARRRRRAVLGTVCKVVREQGPREALPDGAGRIPKSGWVEGRGWDGFDPSSRGWARTAGRPGIEYWEWLGKGSLRGGPAKRGFLGPSHLRGFSRACICSPRLTLPAPKIRPRAAPPPPAFQMGR